MGKRYYESKASPKVKKARYRRQIRTIRDHVLAGDIQNPFTYYDLEELGDANLPEVGIHLHQFLTTTVEAGDLKKTEKGKTTYYGVAIMNGDAAMDKKIASMPEIVERMMNNGQIAGILPKALHDLDDNGGPYDARDIGIAVEEICGVSNIATAHVDIVTADLLKRGIMTDNGDGTYIIPSAAPNPAPPPPSPGQATPPTDPPAPPTPPAPPSPPAEPSAGAAPAGPPPTKKKVGRKLAVSEIPGIRPVDVPRMRKLFSRVKELEFRAVREDWASLGYADQQTYTKRLHEATKAGLLRHIKRGIYQFIMEMVPADWLKEEALPDSPPLLPQPKADADAAVLSRVAALEEDVNALVWVMARRIYEGFLEPLPRHLQRQILHQLELMEDGESEK